MEEAVRDALLQLGQAKVKQLPPPGATCKLQRRCRDALSPDLRPFAPETQLDTLMMRDSHQHLPCAVFICFIDHIVANMCKLVSCKHPSVICTRPWNDRENLRTL
eukprot:5690004-Pleurochrysis_carterae.AAC.1